MNFDLERELEVEARRVRSRAGEDTARLEQLAEKLLHRLMSDHDRARATLLVLERVLEPICGTRAASFLLKGATAESVSARVRSIYGKQVAQMVDVVLKQACA